MQVVSKLNEHTLFDCSCFPGVQIEDSNYQFTIFLHLKWNIRIWSCKLMDTSISTFYTDLMTNFRTWLNQFTKWSGVLLWRYIQECGESHSNRIQRQRLPSLALQLPQTLQVSTIAQREILPIPVHFWTVQTWGPEHSLEFEIRATLQGSVSFKGTSIYRCWRDMYPSFQNHRRCHIAQK